MYLKISNQNLQEEQNKSRNLIDTTIYDEKLLCFRITLYNKIIFYWLNQLSAELSY